MEFARKYSLVPQDLLAQTKHIVTQEHLSELDRDMNSILQNKTLSDAEKVRLYYNILQKKLNMENNNQPWIKDNIETPSDEMTKPAENSVQMESLIFNSVPKNYKRHAENLISIIKSRPETIKFDEQGRVSIRNQLIENSNIIDLINSIATPNRRHVIGQDRFLSALDDLNIPRTFLKNRNLSFVKQEKNDFVSPQPKKKSKRHPVTKWLSLK